PEDVELTTEDLEYLDFTGALSDTMLEHGSPYLPAVLLVDDVLKAETKQEAAYNLAVLIQYLCDKRERNAQVMTGLYMTQQAMSYTPMVIEYMLQTLGMAQAEVGRRILEKKEATP
ncbi:MAG: hypothetical protein M3362_12720, partial [Acidobacteriota bacterium]|nr:hypothetical protein [Acidobacteriota bacterium]